MVYGNYYVVEDEECLSWEKNNSMTLYQDSLIPFSKEACIKNIQGCAPMYKRTVYDKVGGYDEQFLHACDWLFLCDIVSSGSKLLKLDKPLCLYYNNPARTFNLKK